MSRCIKLYVSYVCRHYRQQMEIKQRVRLSCQTTRTFCARKRKEVGAIKIHVVLNTKYATHIQHLLRLGWGLKYMCYQERDQRVRRFVKNQGMACLVPLRYHQSWDLLILLLKRRRLVNFARTWFRVCWKNYTYGLDSWRFPSTEWLLKCRPARNRRIQAEWLRQTVPIFDGPSHQHSPGEMTAPRFRSKAQTSGEVVTVKAAPMPTDTDFSSPTRQKNETCDCGNLSFFESG